MRAFRWTLIVLLLAALVAGGVWSYRHRAQLACQWACRQIATAGSFREAKPQFAWFESGEDAEDRLAELTAGFGAGDESFDRYLIEYVACPDSSPALRRAFSRAVGRDADRLARWAHAWSYRAKLPPQQQVAAIFEYLDQLAAAEQLRTLTWREVLDLQAVLALIGHGEAAENLSVENWHDRYTALVDGWDDKVPPLERPAELLPPKGIRP